MAATRKVEHIKPEGLLLGLEYILFKHLHDYALSLDDAAEMGSSDILEPWPRDDVTLVARLIALIHPYVVTHLPQESACDDMDSYHHRMLYQEMVGAMKTVLEERDEARWDS